MESDSTSCPPAPAPLGEVEPHASLLDAPAAGQLLYKVMSVENLLRSVVGSYLHFNRVDQYKDFPGADSHDAEQSPGDVEQSKKSTFLKAPDVSMADYFADARKRTYACCFSLENSETMWRRYGHEGQMGKVCLVFEFGRLREMLNRELNPTDAVIQYDRQRCRQIFSVNYGLVRYVEWEAHSGERPNQIMYTYLKGRKWSDEKELRVSLSALAPGHYSLNPTAPFEFPKSVQVGFDFTKAIRSGAIRKVLLQSDSGLDLLKVTLGGLRIVRTGAQD